VETFRSTSEEGVFGFICTHSEWRSTFNQAMQFVFKSGTQKRNHHYNPNPATADHISGAFGPNLL
jgi:hypothetical protein